MAAFQLGTISITPTGGVVLVSTSPKTFAQSEEAFHNDSDSKNYNGSVSASVSIFYVWLVSKERFIGLDYYALPSKKQWGVNIGQLPTTNITQIGSTGWLSSL